MAEVYTETRDEQDHGEGNEPAAVWVPSAPTTHPVGFRPRQTAALVLVAALVGAGVSSAVTGVVGGGNKTVIERSAVTAGALTNRPPAIQAIAAKILPSVVAITATSQSSPSSQESTSASVTFKGTGVVVSRDGEVLTNDHVVNDATSISVTVNGSSRSFSASLIAASVDHDLALIKITGASNLTPATFGNSAKTVVGDNVLAVGYALGLPGGPTVTEGIISATERTATPASPSGQTVGLADMLQTDAAISSGDSGGPLVNAAGQVIGIDTLVEPSSPTITAQNIGFAISSRTVAAVLPGLQGEGA